MISTRMYRLWLFLVACFCVFLCVSSSMENSVSSDSFYVGSSQPSINVDTYLNDKSSTLHEDMIIMGEHDTYPLSECEYLIITMSAWKQQFQPLAEWRTKTGIPTNIITVDWIATTFNGEELTEKIQACIQEFHFIYGGKYVLLGADTNGIPTGPSRGDTFFADYDLDSQCEVHIGRASVNSSDDIAVFISKLLTYEKTPPIDSYVEKAGFFGFVLHEGDPPRIPPVSGGTCKEYIATHFMPEDWVITKIFGDMAKDDVIAAINEGQHLVNHIDHGQDSGYALELGDENFTIADVYNLTNGEKYCIFYTIACSGCAISKPVCFAEACMRHPTGGSVAYIGNAWAVVSDLEGTPVFDFDKAFYHSLFVEDHYLLGDCFSDHKNDVMQEGVFGAGMMYEALTLLGDPLLPIWTQQPDDFDDVVFPVEVALEDQEITVSVFDDGDPVDDAVVCLHKDDDIYMVGTTEVDGSIAFPISPQTPGCIDVTVTKHNYIPWEGQAIITDSIPADVNGDGVVDVLDLLLVLGAWDQTGDPGWINEDIVQDGVVDVLDLLEVLAYWS